MPPENSTVIESLGGNWGKTGRTRSIRPICKFDTYDRGESCHGDIRNPGFTIPIVGECKHDESER